MSKYTGASIKTHGIDVNKVRAKPSQYMGGVDEIRFNMWREVFDNCVDEHIAGRNNFIHVMLDLQGRRVTVLDHGTGIPTEEKKVDRIGGGHVKMSAITAVLTLLNAGGKFDSAAYEKSRGTHGVGITGTNALSKELTVWSAYKGKPVMQSFAAGIPTSKLKPAKLPTFKVGKQTFKMAKKGTAISFVYDDKLLGKSADISLSHVIKLCDQTAYLNPKLVIHLSVAGKKGSKVFHHKGGTLDYIKNEIEQLGCGTLGKPCIINTKEFDVAFQFTDHDEELFLGYTNSLPQIDGGVHVDAFRKTLFASLKAMASSRDKEFTQNDLRDGLVGLIDVKISSPAFGSQTKEKLVDARIKDMEKPMRTHIDKFFSAHKSLAKEIIRRAGELKELRQEQLKDKRALKALKGASSGKKDPPPNKYTAVDSRKYKPEVAELYLVEGDSAGGTAKEARFPHQGVLKLRGKILNVMRDFKGKAFESDEVLNILLALGYDPSRGDKAMGELRYGKLILLADPDPDGHHINSLLLALLVKFLPQMFADGRVYAAQVREYYASYKDVNYFGDSPVDVMKQLPKDAKVTVRHIKGWGEVGPDVLNELAFDPHKRKLVKLKGLTKDDLKRFGALMGEDTEYRRNLLNIKL